MPYIITTAVPWGVPIEGLDRCAVYSERAVATLDEARQAAKDALPATAPLSLHFQCEDLTEQGGTVGALPDGTAIEVERVSDDTLSRMVGTDPLDAEPWTVIEAFNAGQEA